MTAAPAMLRRRLTRRLSTVAVAVVLGVPAASLVSGCGVNFGAQTDQPYNPAAGVDDRTGGVYVLNALVVSGSDGSGTFIAQLVNNDQHRSDELKQVSGSGQDASLQTTPSGTTTIAAGAALNLATSRAQWTVSSQRVVPGNFVRLTLTFAHASPVSMAVPVVSGSDPQYSQVKLPSSTSSSSASSSASPSSSGSSSSSPSTSPSDLASSSATPSSAESPSQ